MILQEGEEFVNEPFENTLTPSSTFRPQNFVRIGETRKYDQVFFDSPFPGLAEGQRMSENLMCVPADEPCRAASVMIQDTMELQGPKCCF
jgi:hypothetical protein